ncbi:hypothetical protein EON83_17825 [bacterium]|nr:MAG: hypothetical protein EON83_17825 [bacterium]
MNRFESALTLGVAMTLGGALPAGAQEITASPSGIQTLRYGETAFNWIRPKVKSTSVYGDVTLRATLTRGDGSSSDSEAPKRTAVEGGNDATYKWGTVRTRVSTTMGRVTWRVRVENTSNDTLSIKEVRLIELMFPGGYQGFTNNANGDGVDSPAFLLGAWPETTQEGGPTQKAGKIAFVLEQGTGKLVIGTRYYGAFPLKFIPTSAIEPGESRLYSVSLRFGAADATPIQFIPDALQRARQSQPFIIKWADRRPLGRWFLASSGKHPATNVRGWFNNDAKTDITTEAGRAAFAQRMLTTAGEIAKRNTAMNGQGVVLWDVEGQQFGHPISYLGLPLIRDLDGKVKSASLPPEMEEPVLYGGTTKPLIDHVFDILRMSGKLGICIRPTNALTSAFSKPIFPSHYLEADWAQTLIDKISYAKARWGCSIFYIDSNLPDASQLRKVAMAHPDVLLIPEWSSPFTQASGASYRSAENLGQIEPLSLGRQLYPQSFGVIAAGAKNFANNRVRLAAELRKGSILFYNAWFDDKSINVPVKSLYDEAH